MARGFIWAGLLVGSTVGGLLPALWGGEMLSGIGILLSMIGAVAGIFAGYKIAQSVG